jgi:hypothetical protein
MLTLLAVVIGGVITLLAQIALERLNESRKKRRKDEQSRAAVRVIRFHFFAAEHVLKRCLETGFWWSSAAGINVAAAGEALDTLAELLPEEQWRIYTGAWRRLRGCIQRYDGSVHKPVSNDSSMGVAELTYGHDLILQRIEPADLKFLLATFVTVDQARHALEKYVVDSTTQEVKLGPLCLNKEQIHQALEDAGRFVKRDDWERILQPSE